jgi:hypothetical protein
VCKFVEAPEIQTTEIPDTIPVNTTTHLQAAFGFGHTTNTNKSKDWQDDDLGISYKSISTGNYCLNF